MLAHDPCTWHIYEIDWGAEEVTFCLDGHTLLQTEVVPRGPLGLVAWIDNQYASLPPDGHLGYGTLENEQAAWIEVEDLNLTFA